MKYFFILDLGNKYKNLIQPSDLFARDIFLLLYRFYKKGQEIYFVIMRCLLEIISITYKAMRNFPTLMGKTLTQMTCSTYEVYLASSLVGSIGSSYPNMQNLSDL